jgi:predicted O-methyltransferase YrrM
VDETIRGTARRVLSVGASTADVAARALASDGMLILMERDASIASQARLRFLSTGLDRRVTVIAGEPSRMIYKLSGPFDVIFCDDAERRLRDILAKLLAPGGVLIINDDL